MENSRRCYCFVAARSGRGSRARPETGGRALPRARPRLPVLSHPGPWCAGIHAGAFCVGRRVARAIARWQGHRHPLPRRNRADGLGCGKPVASPGRSSQRGVSHAQPLSRCRHAGHRGSSTVGGEICAVSETRHLTTPSSGRPKARCARFGPPLMSNVRSHEAASCQLGVLASGLVCVAARGAVCVHIGEGPARRNQHLWRSAGPAEVLRHAGLGELRFAWHSVGKPRVACHRRATRPCRRRSGRRRSRARSIRRPSGIAISRLTCALAHVWSNRRRTMQRLVRSCNSQARCGQVRRKRSKQASSCEHGAGANRGRVLSAWLGAVASSGQGSRAHVA